MSIYDDNKNGTLAKLANALALGASGAILLGSSPRCPTSFSSTTGLKKCCDRCCIEDNVLHCRKGMDR